MNPVVKIITDIVISINRIIDSIDKKTAEAIKNSFFFFIFILMVIGVIVGYRLGKGDAKIKSPPLVKQTDDIFKIDINREKDNGSFTTLLESTAINELKDSEMKKNRFSTQEKISDELEFRKITPMETIDNKISPDLNVKERLFEGEYHQKIKPSNIKQLEKKIKSKEKWDNSIPKNEKLEQINSSFEKDKNLNSDKTLRKNDKQKELKHIKKDTGIIEN